MARTKKVKAAGRFGAGYGLRVRTRLKKIELIQRKRQVCPFCKKTTIKKIAAGIWYCKSCKRKFASNAYTTSKE
jgi:large subunit ribosomal protein L37Ae